MHNIIREHRSATFVRDAVCVGSTRHIEPPIQLVEQPLTTPFYASGTRHTIHFLKFYRSSLPPAVLSSLRNAYLTALDPKATLTMAPVYRQIDRAESNSERRRSLSFRDLNTLLQIYREYRFYSQDGIPSAAKQQERSRSNVLWFLEKRNYEIMSFLRMKNL